MTTEITLEIAEKKEAIVAGWLPATSNAHTITVSQEYIQPAAQPPH
jgi:hypothetical protein